MNKTEKVTGIVHPKILCVTVMWNLISIHALSKTAWPMLEPIPVSRAENVICWGFSFNIVKGIVHQKKKMLKIHSPSGHPRCRWVCFFIRTDLRVQTADKNINNPRVIHITTGDGSIITDYGCYYGILTRSNSLKLKSLNDGYFFQTLSFSLHKTLIDGLELYALLVDYCDVFSSWRHPFTAEDPLLWYNAKFQQIQWRNKLIYTLDGQSVSNFSANFWVSYYFNKIESCLKNKLWKQNAILIWLDLKG